MAIDTPYAVEPQAVVDVLVEAFADDPVVCWLFPDPGERGRFQAMFYRFLLTHPAAEAYLTDGGEGAAIWLTLGPDETLHDDQPGSGAVFGERMRALSQALDRRHPTGARHLYLPCVGVTGERRGAGLGSAMLRRRLDRADADGLGTYLEASSARSRALYLRHGFEDLGAPVQPAGGPPLWPMWRPPFPTSEERNTHD
ncbi:GNAT family N-acetyltransferase [Nonomuraea sp. NPDC050783]|uniref:GNAT family N-acetyltransferase n=1 Tax=Nonomuraea sp. NPDC050783 TaxID=3154634 RepID=UPI003466C12C